MNNSIQFELAEFSKIFPFYILFDENLIIQDYGPSIGKIAPDCKNKQFLDFFTIERPLLSEINFLEIRAITNQLVFIKSNKSEILLKGQFNFLADRQEIVFLGAAWFDSTETLNNSGLNLLDYAPNNTLIDLLHLLKTQEINKRFCTMLGYDYSFLPIDNEDTMHPATKKIQIVHDFLQTAQYDTVVFLDSDAWIQNGHWLHHILTHLSKSNKHGCFSRDPYSVENTYINSGSFILKINEFTKKMYSVILADLHSDTKHHRVFPYDQYYISNYVFEHKDQFVIFVPDILNTPDGKVLRHNWWKNEKMYTDLKNLNTNIDAEKIDTSVFHEKSYYDHHPFPNTNFPWIFIALFIVFIVFIVGVFYRKKIFKIRRR